MGENCFFRGPGVTKMIELFGVNKYNAMEKTALEIGAAPQLNSVRTEGQLVNSPLFQDIQKELSFLSEEDRNVEAFSIYTEVYSPKFIEKYGDWTKFPNNYKGSRYSETLEPKLYLLEDAGLIPKKKSTVGTKLDSFEKSVKFLEESIKELEDKLKILQTKVTNSDKEDEVTRLKETISRIKLSIENKEKGLENKQIQLGVIAYLGYIKDDVVSKYKYRIDNLEKDPDSHLLNEIRSFLEMHKSSLLTVRRYLKNSPEFKDFYDTTVRETVDNLQKDIEDIEGFFEDNFNDTVKRVVSENYPEAKEEDIDNWFRAGVKDMWGMGKYFGIPSDSRDPIVRLIINMIQKIHKKVQKVVIPAIEDLKTLQIELNKAGFTDMSIFNEKHEGKSTGFLINKTKWGEYYIEENKVQQKIMDKLQIDNWDSVIRSLDNENVRKVYQEEYKEFNSKYRKPNGFGGYEADITKFENKKFNELIQNKAFANYYNALYDIHTKSKGNQPASYRIGKQRYMLPQIPKNELEALKKDGLKGGKEVVSRKLRGIAKKIEGDEAEYGDIIRDRNGKILKLIPLHYNSYLSDQNQLSDDITAMYYTYYTMSENFKQTAKSIDDIELIHQAMGRREKPTKNSVSLVENLIAMHIYGEKVEDIMIKGYNLTKLLDIALKKYPSTVNMAFNLAVTVSGAAKSEIDTIVENFIGSATSNSSNLKAKAEMIKQFPAVLAEIGSRKKTNKLDLMLIHNGSDEVIRKAYKNLNIDTKAARMISSDLFYVTMMPFGYRTTAKLMLSMYYNYRLVNGKFITEDNLRKEYKIKSQAKTNKEFEESNYYKEFKVIWKEVENKSLYDAYEVNNGKVEIKKEFKKYITEDFEIFFANKLEKLTSRLEGTRSKFDKAVIDRSVFGGAVMLHRSWLPQMISQRFKGKNYDLATGQDEEGFYITIGRLLSNMIEKTDSGMKLKFSVWQNLEGFEKQNVIRFLGDTTALVVLSILATVLNRIADDDDEDIWFYEYLAYQANRLLLEQKALSPIPIIGGGITELFNILKSPMAAINQWEKITNLGTLIGNFNNVIQSGAYKDKTQGERFFIQQTWLKNLYELQYPESKNSYLKSQILN